MLDIKNNLFQYRDENKNIKIAVAMSGGVDSTTVAYLLKKQGYNIIGITMRTCKDEDADAKKIADDLGIEHYVYDATKSFKEKKEVYKNESYLLCLEEIVNGNSVWNKKKIEERENSLLEAAKVIWADVY